MIKKLRYHSNSKICLDQVKLPMLTLILLLMGPANNFLVAQEPQDKLFGSAEMSLSYDFDECRSFSGDNSPFEYSEFTSEEGNSCAGISSGHLYRHAGKHSCTDDAQGNAGDAACFQSSTDDNYSENHELAIRFDVTLEGLTDRSSRLDGISFQQLAPQNYLWSAEGYQSSTGPNNYPTKFGIRVLKDNVEIYVEDNIATTQSWETTAFNFNDNEHFQVSAGTTSIFTFELISYAPVGNGAAVSAWDLDNLKVFTACEIECNLTVDAGDDVNSCENEEVTLSATTDGVAECDGGCEYPIEQVSRCSNSSNLSDVWLTNITGNNKGFVTSTSSFKTFENGTAQYTATGSNGIDTIEVDITFSGYTTTAPPESPKENNCDPYDTSDWVYWTTTTGTIISQQHGTLNISRKGPSMQMGNGADVTRTGFGASGWLTISGGDGFYLAGDVNIKLGDCIPIAGNSSVNYLWSTGETTESITVSESGEYTVTVEDCKGCTATDKVMVTFEDKVIIGDYVWLDENRNGLQDDGATGVNGISVELYQCETGSKPAALLASTETSDGANGAGYYQFEVCPNSGEYYIVFGAIPEELEFTVANAGDILKDSNADTNGQTECFIINAEDDLSIDAGLNEICDLDVDAGEETEICIDSNSSVELTATIEDSSDECPGGCVYPILEQERCFGPTGTFEIWLASKGGLSSWAFTASEQRFERLANGDAKYTATASNGVDIIEMDVTFTGYTTTATLGSPKENECQDYDTSDWEYWTTWNGTITSQNHGVYTMSMKGAPFQMGVGADVTRTGFGASGWFNVEGGDEYYTGGDVNITLAECQENGVEYKWTTEDGNIVSDPYKKTISVDKPGTYIFEAMNCIDCFTTDKVTVKAMNCGKSTVDKESKIATVYPIPVASGGTLTIEFGKEETTATTEKSFGPQLKEDVSVVVYDMQGRMISIPRTFKMVDGKAIIYLDIDSIPSGKYIVRAQGNNWAESKHILVK